MTNSTYEETSGLLYIVTSWDVTYSMSQSPTEQGRSPHCHGP